MFNVELNALGVEKGGTFQLNRGAKLEKTNIEGQEKTRTIDNRLTL